MMAKLKNILRASAFAVIACCTSTAAFTAPQLTVKILETYPHDSQSFTQGLIYSDGDLIESSGLYGKSFIRRYSAETGEIKTAATLPAAVFAEGIETIDSELLVLTWKSGILFRFDAKTFKLKQTQRYKGQGWGLTKINDRLVMSNGSARISFRDPHTFKELNTKLILNDKVPLTDINELEFDGTWLWANQWKNKSVFKIDPKNGKVIAEASLETLVPDSEKQSDQNVLNGIAYVPEKNAFWVTGKRWPKRFLVQFLSH